MDASNMLKPALARGTLRCCGATTTDEYRKYIEKDPALARRFQSVMVDEPSVQDTISILRGLKERYEIHHGVSISDNALVTAAVQSHRYITNRFLPDKAIDLVDEACSKLRLQQESKPDLIEQLDRSIMTIQIELESLKKEKDVASQERRRKLEEDLLEKRQESTRLSEIWKEERDKLRDIKSVKEQLEKARMDLETAQRTGNFSRASELQYGVIPSLEKKLPSDTDAGGADKPILLHERVTSDDISQVISHMTGIPVQALMQGEREKLLHMEDALEQHVVGQAPAIRAISDAVRLSRSGLSSAQRPIASFIFLGPTGVGKTELTKALARLLFDSEQSIVRIDMSEYMERFSVSRLTGAPPGYVGYEEGGELTEAIRRKPYSIVLLDEIEKAHKDVTNLLLQILDEGHLTDSQGRRVDFRNTIIVMTSNLGAEALVSMDNMNGARNVVMQAVQRHFSPEFINRVDDMIVFNKLSKEALRQIVDIRLNQVQERVMDRRIFLHIDADAKDHLATHGYDPAYGARPLNRIIQKELLNPLARLLIQGQVHDNQQVIVTVRDGALNLAPGKEA
jgi:ATP-dependent Clp protease ATP-binding subunit ClpB